MAIIDEVMARRGRPYPGGNPIQFVEKYGGTMVEMTAFEPDPCTCREPYYYNTARNILYKLVITQRLPYRIAHWKRIS